MQAKEPPTRFQKPYNKHLLTLSHQIDFTEGLNFDVQIFNLAAQTLDDDNYYLEVLDTTPLYFVAPTTTDDFQFLHKLYLEFDFGQGNDVGLDMRTNSKRPLVMGGFEVAEQFAIGNSSVLKLSFKSNGSLPIKANVDLLRNKTISVRVVFFNEDSLQFEPYSLSGSHHSVTGVQSGEHLWRPSNTFEVVACIKNYV